MSVQIRPVSAGQLEAFQKTLGVIFGIEITPELVERFNNVLEVERLRGAFDGDQLVATFGAFSLRMSVPGGMLPVAGTTVVTVLSTHRRQGILRTLMTEHLAELYHRGEPLAALWASESSIYGRFGYGPASERVLMKLEKPFARMHEPPDIQGTMRMVERDEALRVFPAVFEKVARQRPGMYLRHPTWWEHRALGDPAALRRGATAHRRVLYVRDGQPMGYVIYRTKTDWAAGTAELELVELIGVDAEAKKALWQYLFGVDLISKISYWNQPVDDPLRWWLEQPRRMERTIEDALWVRPVDVAAALSGRRFSCAGSLVLRMHDQVCPWNDGVYRLQVDDQGTADCQRTDADAQIALTPYALGAIYLGAYRLRDLAHSGVVRGTPEALARADAMFTWDPPPWCQEIF
jgi:predicted acetyltransferase